MPTIVPCEIFKSVLGYASIIICDQPSAFIRLATDLLRLVGFPQITVCLHWDRDSVGRAIRTSDILSIQYYFGQFSKPWHQTDKNNDRC